MLSLIKQSAFILQGPEHVYNDYNWVKCKKNLKWVDVIKSRIHYFWDEEIKSRASILQLSIWQENKSLMTSRIGTTSSQRLFKSTEDNL